ncbi:MAG: plasmid pRiA4b ORF-3 family protein [Planctomycetaceae bacterium]
MPRPRKSTARDRSLAQAPAPAVGTSLRQLLRRQQQAPPGELAPRDDLLLQFRIELLEIDPPVWRRIVIPDGTLEDLHFHIQGAFGWDDCHLHVFEIENQTYGPVLEDGRPVDEEMEDDEINVLVSEFLPPPTKNGKVRRKFRFRYVYDFGDEWGHELLFEGYPQRIPRRKYPLCVDGARACPPEDIGGPWRYYDLLDALNDPDHEWRDLVEALRFDPEKFDAAKATRAMRRFARDGE